MQVNLNTHQTEHTTHRITPQFQQHLTWELALMTRRDPLHRLSSYKELWTSPTHPHTHTQGQLRVTPQQCEQTVRFLYFYILLSGLKKKKSDRCLQCLIQTVLCEEAFNWNILLLRSTNSDAVAHAGVEKCRSKVSGRCSGEKGELEMNQPYDKAPACTDWVTCRTARRDEEGRNNDACMRNKWINI